MSKIFRRLPLSRLLLVCAIVVATAVGGAAIALAVGNGPTPPPKPLANAIHDALSAKPVQGVSARVQLTDHLVEGTQLAGQSPSGGASSNPLLTGASGRLWISREGKVRLELQSDHGATQLLYDGRTLTLYDASSNTLYQYTPPAHTNAGEGGAGAHQGHVPTVAEIKQAISTAMGHVDISGATPTDVAGHPAYSVTISPKRDGGLVGGAELAWDATHGVPLRLAIYAKGDRTPVLELTATEVSYGQVPSSIFSLALPQNVKRTTIKPPSHSQSASHHPRINAKTTGLKAVAAAVPFKLQAPATLAGMQRHEVRLIEANGHEAALIGYGEGLGGIVVIETKAGAGQTTPSSAGGSSSLTLPKVSINGAKASELPTALGTILSFRSGGVEHILAGSVTPATIEAAARGL